MKFFSSADTPGKVGKETTDMKRPPALHLPTRPIPHRAHHTQESPQSHIPSPTVPSPLLHTDPEASHPHRISRPNVQIHPRRVTSVPDTARCPSRIRLDSETTDNVESHQEWKKRETHQWKDSDWGLREVRHFVSAHRLCRIVGLLQ